MSMKLLTLFLLAALRLLTFDVDATPPEGSELAYQTMQGSSAFSLRARGVVLFGTDDPIVLCCIDWIGIANESQDAFKRALSRAAGTTPDRVAVHTLHQHDAPICDFTAEKILFEKGMDPAQFEGSFARSLIHRLEECIKGSLENAVPVTDVGFGKARVRKIASNRTVKLKDGSFSTRYSSEPTRKEYRRMGRGLIDPEVSLVSFWNGDNPVAVLSFYATHPQSYYLTGIANPDFPGIARAMRDLEEPDAFHVHFNGAGGNVAAGKYNDGSHKMRLVLAKRLEKGMRSAWKKTRKQPIESVKWATFPLLLPPDDGIAELESSILSMSRNQLSNSVGRLGWYRRRKQGQAIQVSCLSVNDVRMLFMPGELFVEYQIAAKKIAPDKFVTVAAYGDYGPFYIGTKKAYESDVYEIRSSPVRAEAEEYIMKAMTILLNDQMNISP